MTQTPRPVTPITELRDLLTDEITDDLVAAGQAHASVDEVKPEVWRRCARAAARSLGRPVRTFEFDGAVHAGLTDWPATPAEQAIHAQAMRRAMEAASDGLALRPQLRSVD